MAKRPDYNVYVTEKNGDKNYYHQVGVAWDVSNDGISIKLRPNLAISGECVLFPPKEDEQ
ncbi:MAG: hypothetical protein C0429_09620 [Sphingopyxis sp.]|nr:hypothetical protein [Sphingopyxis sp.]